MKTNNGILYEQLHLNIVNGGAAPFHLVYWVGFAIVHWQERAVSAKLAS